MIVFNEKINVKHFDSYSDSRYIWQCYYFFFLGGGGRWGRRTPSNGPFTPTHKLVLISEKGPGKLCLVTKVTSSHASFSVLNKLYPLAITHCNNNCYV